MIYIKNQSYIFFKYWEDWIGIEKKLITCHWESGLIAKGMMIFHVCFLTTLKMLACSCMYTTLKRMASLYCNSHRPLLIQAHCPQTRQRLLRLLDVTEVLVVDRGLAQHGVAGVIIIVIFVLLLLFYNIDLTNQFCSQLEKDAFAVGTASVLLQFLPHGLNGITNLQGRPQFDGHG